MAPPKRQVKATRHLVCGSCSNRVDFVKSGCEKSWAAGQADSLVFSVRDMALVGREEVGFVGGSRGGTVDDKVGEGDQKDARESSPHLGRRLRGGKDGGRLDGMRQDGRR